MNYRGDQREQLTPGTRLGPDHTGLIHEVTEATYDAATDTTRIRTRTLELEDQRLRYTGGAQ